MKNNSYFVKGLIGLGLIGSVAFASSDIGFKSSIQLKGDVLEKEENKAAKIDVSEVCKILKKDENGKIINVNLENEDGNLVYHSEIIKDSGETLDVIVDAGNGKILHKQVDKSDKESEEDDKNEKSKD